MANNCKNEDMMIRPIYQFKYWWSLPFLCKLGFHMKWGNHEFEEIWHHTKACYFTCSRCDSFLGYMKENH